MKTKLFIFVMSIIIQFAFIALVLFWLSYRKLSIRPLDYFIILIGFLSMSWIFIWLKYFSHKNQPLIIPWGPMFFIPLAVILGGDFGLIPGYETMNFLVLFFCGYMISPPTINLFRIITGINVSTPIKKSRTIRRNPKLFPVDIIQK